MRKTGVGSGGSGVPEGAGSVLFFELGAITKMSLSHTILIWAVFCDSCYTSMKFTNPGTCQGKGGVCKCVDSRAGLPASNPAHLLTSTVSVNSVYSLAEWAWFHIYI
jgi:hypothetical protein